MAKDNLKQKAASGMVWTAVQKYSTMIIGFISGIILARLLEPEDYGAIGMLAIFMSLAEVFIDAGFGSALIQKKEPTQTDYSTVFYFNIVMSLVLYLVLFFSAPAIARFFRMPILTDVLRVQGLVLFIYAFNIIQRNQIRKKLRFKKLSTITIITAIVSLIVTVIMAYKGCGVWSLVVQNILGALVPCVFFWVTTNWRPSWEYSWKSFKELFGFGSFMFLTSIFTTFSQRITGLLVGRWYDPTTMGYYSKASTTSKQMTLSVSGVMIQTTYPLYASVQDDKERLINMVKRITSTLAYISVPILCLLIVVAKPLFVLLYSDRWLASVPYFQMLCVGGIAGCLLSVNQQTIAAIGKSKVFFIWTIIKEGVGIALQVIGLIVWGMWGLLAGKVISSWFSYFVNISLVSKYVGYKNYQQLKDLLPVFLVSGIAMAISYLVSSMLSLGLYQDGIIKAMVFAVVYLSWSLVIKPEAYNYSLSVIKSLKKTKNKVEAA
ncbi:MAG: lipopolysaccharide biosynthesis protein [Bacteroidales bacterium]|nr:lipopolysaccharide biosynthesis protein [Bacteroidales bacterium]